MSNAAKLTRIFSAVAGVALLTGCATTPFLNKDSCMEEEKTSVLFGLFSSGKRQYNQSCALDKSAGQLVGSGDLGMKAVGQAILERQHESVKDTTEVVRDVIRKETTSEINCKIQSVENGAEGKRVIRLGNCTPVSP